MAQQYRFNAEAFYKKKDEQRGKCAISGVVLEPATVDVSHSVPLDKGGTHCFENIDLVHRDLVKMARILTNDEILSYAVKIVNHLGKEKGYCVKKK
ncbi:MAG: hypothetical protein KDK41_17175 [Leptospiraceae bacterium]|nr:hypothetical protein [Leptospiraceae bacterium]